ncbi:hypothetical protein AMJ85_04130, partial [candidate division BRC1 bacterium SM23_51]
GVYACDGLAYVADSEEGVYILDVSDPTSPKPCGFFNIPGAEDVFVADGLIYVPASTGGLLILRYTPPVARTTPTWPLYE